MKILNSITKTLILASNVVLILERPDLIHPNQLLSNSKSDTVALRLPTWNSAGDLIGYRVCVGRIMRRAGADREAYHFW